MTGNRLPPLEQGARAVRRHPSLLSRIFTLASVLDRSRHARLSRQRNVFHFLNRPNNPAGFLLP